MTADTQFLLASVSKNVTAAAVLRLVKQGRVDLDAPIARYLPSDLRVDTNGATVRQVLQMRWPWCCGRDRLSRRSWAWRSRRSLRHAGPRRGPAKPGIVGIIGANRAGKTTLFRMLVGQEPPDAGTIQIGDTVKLSYVDQGRDELRADRTVFQEITDGVEVVKVGSRGIPARAYVSSFNFRSTYQQKLVGTLSGSERNRVHLARLLQSGGNVLLLDEPTNDLDVDTLRALEAGLESFPGCVVVISHDRWFLDRIATHILAFEGDSKVRLFEGNVSEYEAFRHRELGAAADQPHPLRYKRLAG